MLISLCGAGGKTSTLFWLAEHLRQSGKRVLITTTTRMFLPDPSQYRQLIIEHAAERQLAACKALPAGGGITALFRSIDLESNKVSGPEPENLDRIKAENLFDVILVEADGANRRLLKVPAAHEPCIPGASDIVIALTGGAMIGAQASPETIHRWEGFQALTGLKEGEVIGWAVLDRLLGHPEGFFKGAPSLSRRIWFINGAYQNESDWQPELIRLLGSHPEIEAIWQGAVQETEAIRHCWRHRPVPA
jgi:probable selenium-dependent hydroxylase accessory protein YqeC